MKERYRIELEALPATYLQARSADIGYLRWVLDMLGGDPCLFIGSGGAIAVAELASQLHRQRCRQTARACTPLEAVDTPQLPRQGALLLCPSARHRDARQVLEDFRRGRFAPAVLATHGDGREIEDAAGGDTIVIAFPPLDRADGFTATGSILQFATLLLRAYLPRTELPRRLPPVEGEVTPPRDRVLVLTPPALRSVAVDLRVRLGESGLAAVQLSDFRNFALTGHVGFARRSEHTTVIVLSSTESDPLAIATIQALPSRFDVRRWHIASPWEEAVIPLLHRSMHLGGVTAATAGVDLARPKIPTFGHRLYRLRADEPATARTAGGVERKLLAAGIGETHSARASYEAAAAAWRERVARLRFAGLVMAFEGTVCWGNRPSQAPAQAIINLLRGFLERDILIGFASRRGHSLHTDLRRWMPTQMWERVTVGLYNGGLVLTLADELPEPSRLTTWSQSVIGAIASVAASQHLEVVDRGLLVSITRIGVGELTTLAAAVVDRLASCGGQARTTVSANAVDVTPTASTKMRVVERLQTRTGGLALAIGDQGQLGGSDHELLAGRPGTLTVEQCSPDPESCWFAGDGELHGPAMLTRYLRNLRWCRDGVAFSPGPFA